MSASRQYLFLQNKGNKRSTLHSIFSILCSKKFNQCFLLIRYPVREEVVEGNGESNRGDWIAQEDLRPDSPIEEASVGGMTKDGVYSGRHELVLVSLLDRDLMLEV